MRPIDVAKTRGDEPAILMTGSGDSVTWRQLESDSARLARYLRQRGLREGDHIALLLENRPEYLVAAWAAMRSGLYYTPINWHLAADEAAYIVSDCGAKALLTSATLIELATTLRAKPNRPDILLSCDPGLDGYETLNEALDGVSSDPLPDEHEGQVMFYSSGTTGRPKGIFRPLEGIPFGTPSRLEQLLPALYGFGPDTKYLCPAPLYHAAPLGWSIGTQRIGGTVVIMERFDAEDTLRLIERHKITHAQFVPTMFVRMLKLPEDVRRKYDLSSLRSVIHAAAPCPVDVKQQMMDWWGPVIHEYYAGSEGNGFVAIGPEDWLAHKGSVGRATRGKIHIVDDAGEPLPPREVGTVYFEDAGDFEYYGDPEKTANAYNERGWSTLGDVGWLDEEGYLYLTDRKTYMIISGGVNIYPQEVENVLTMHPAVLDVAVIGVPNEDFGEEVKAVVQPVRYSDAGESLEAELIEYCRNNISHYKCPRSIDFVDDFPRLPNGKLLKRTLRERYWPTGKSV